MKPAGKRSGGREGKPSSFSDRQLSQFLSRLEASNDLDQSSTVDDIVDHLRDRYRDYTRLKHQDFKRFVARTLSSPSFQRLPEPQPPSSEGEELDLAGADSSERQRKRAQDEIEIEEGHVRKIRLSNGDDLMKSMLRESYTDPKSGAKLKVGPQQEENVEMDIPGREKMKILAGSRGLKPQKAESSVSKGGSLEVSRNDTIKFSDLGGMRKVLAKLHKEVIRPLRHPWLNSWLGVEPMSGILLCGPPGCGKTTLAHAIANETGVPFYKISATEVVSGVSGASEANIRDLFSKANRTAPSIVFIDEIDAIASKRENMQRDMERRLVIQLMTCMDQSRRPVQKADENLEAQTSAYVLVIGATNRPDALDPALRRPGRFDHEIFLAVPDENSRLEILSVVMSRRRLEGSFDLLKIARSTPGYVGAHLAQLAKRTGIIAMNRILDKWYLTKQEGKADLWRESEKKDKEKFAISMTDFEEALKVVQPSSKREGFSEIPNVK